MNDELILIQYHTIHVNPLIEPIIVLPSPKPKVITVPKVAAKPKVATIEPMKKSNCLFIKNLPFKFAPKDS